jgi:hypothetical protein
VFSKFFVITLKGILYCFAYLKPYASGLLLTINFTFAGKSFSRQLLIIERRLDPLPDIKTHKGSLIIFC